MAKQVSRAHPPAPVAETPTNPDPAAALRDVKRLIRSAREMFGKYSNLLLWTAVAVVVASRLADFRGLAYGNTDDITVDYHSMRMGWASAAYSYATNQSRAFSLFTIPVYSFTMSLAGTGWYDLLNLSSFTLGSTLPAIALRRYFSSTSRQLYCVVYFAALPLLFSYCPPYAYPTYMFMPLVLCAVALILFQRWRIAGIARVRRLLMMAASASLFLALCGYEPAALVTLAFISIYLWASQRENRARPMYRRPDAWAALSVMIVYFLIYAGFRMHFPSSYSGVDPILRVSLPGALRTIGTLSLTSSIFGWYHFPQTLVYVDAASSYQQARPLFAAMPGQLVRQATLGQGLIAAFTALISYRLITAPEPPRILDRFAPMGAAGGVLLFLPNVLYAFIPKISNLVLHGQLFAYTATSYSQIGFALILVAIASACQHIPQRAMKQAAAMALAVVIGWGSLTASDFNRASVISGREQEAKWKAIRYVDACSNLIPSPYFRRVFAPRLWSYSTAALSWGDPTQDVGYLDLFSLARLGLRVHFIRKLDAGFTPLTALDYHVDADGNLDSVVIARSADGRRFQEALVIKKAGAQIGAGVLDGNSTWLSESSANTGACEGELELVHFSGEDLNPSTAVAHGLPVWKPAPVR